jgi:hypothetical protein
VDHEERAVGHHHFVAGQRDATSRRWRKAVDVGDLLP